MLEELAVSLLRLHQIPEDRFLSESIFQLYADLFRDQFGQTVNLAVRYPHHPAYIPHRSPGGHRSEGYYLGDTLLPVFLHNISDDLTATLVTEIDVYIRHGDTLGIEESLKEKPISDRVDFGNF